MKNCRLCSESYWELGVSYYSMKQLDFVVICSTQNFLYSAYETIILVNVYF